MTAAVTLLFTFVAFAAVAAFGWPVFAHDYRQVRDWLRSRRS